MNTNYCAFDHKAWSEAGLKDFGDFADSVEYINQEDFGDCTEGEWFYADDETMTVYTGSFGNYNSPGASSYTYADVYDDRAEYDARVAELESMSEYVEWDDDEYTEYEDGPVEDYL